MHVNGTGLNLKKIYLNLKKPMQEGTPADQPEYSGLVHNTVLYFSILGCALQANFSKVYGG